MARFSKTFLHICFLFSSAGLLLSSSCSDNLVDTDDESIVVLQIDLPKQKAQYIDGQEIELILDIKDDYPEAILKIFINDSLWLEQKGAKKKEKHILSTKDWLLGYSKIKVRLEGVEDDLVSKTVDVVVFANEPAQILIPEIKQSYPHNTSHYTQGFEFYEGRLFEGTGQYAQSVLAEINLKTGNAMRIVNLPEDQFGEGITILNDEIFQLTWLNKICYVYDINTLSIKRQLSFTGEGWGLANNGNEIIMSNGSSELVFRDPQTFQVIRKIQVFSDQQEYKALNELEYVDGFIYANVYQQDYILKINAKTGQVVALIDAEELVQLGKGSGEVLNGITFNSTNGLFYITGKNWEKTFAVSLKEKSAL